MKVLLAVLACSLACTGHAVAASISWSGTLAVGESYQQTLGCGGSSSGSFSTSWVIDEANGTTAETGPGVFEGLWRLYRTGTPTFAAQGSQTCVDEFGCTRSNQARDPGLEVLPPDAIVRVRYTQADRRLEITPSDQTAASYVDALFIRDGSCPGGTPDHAEERHSALEVLAVPRLERHPPQKPRADYRIPVVRHLSDFRVRRDVSHTEKGADATLPFLGSPVTTFGFTTLNGSGPYEFTQTNRLDLKGKLDVAYRRLTIVNPFPGLVVPQTDGIDAAGFVYGRACEAAVCVSYFPAGTVVELVMDKVSPPYAFAGWRGCSPEPATVCTVRMDGNRTVTPRYDTKNELILITRQLSAATRPLERRLRSQGLSAAAAVRERMKAREPGTLVQTVTGRGEVLAAGRHRFGKPGPGILHLRLTAAGRSVVAAGARPRLRIVTTFRVKHLPPVTVRRTVGAG